METNYNDIGFEEGEDFYLDGALSHYTVGEINHETKQVLHNGGGAAKWESFEEFLNRDPRKRLRRPASGPEGTGRDRAQP